MKEKGWIVFKVQIRMAEEFGLSFSWEFAHRDYRGKQA